MMNKKAYIAAAVGSAIVFSSALTLTAFAESEGDRGKGPVQAIEHALDRLEKYETKDFQKPLETAPLTLAVNSMGQVKITNGKVTAINGDTMSVEIWKMTFSVHKMPDTKIFAGKVKEFMWGQTKVGDTVDVLGNLDTTQVMFIHALVVNNRTQLIKVRDDEVGRIRQLINDLIARLNEILRKQGREPVPTSETPRPSPSASPSQSPSPSPSTS